MSRFDSELKPRVQIQQSAVEPVQAFFEHLQQQYRYAPWYTSKQMEEWKTEAGSGQIQAYVAYQPGTEEIAGAVLVRLAFAGGAHIICLVADKQFAGLQITRKMARYLQAQYSWLTLIAVPLIPELEISEEDLVTAYKGLGFKVGKKIYHGTEMKWMRKKIPFNEKAEA